MAVIDKSVQSDIAPATSGEFLGWRLTDEERAILELVDEVCRRELVPVRRELDEREEFPVSILETFRRIGLYGALFPEEYGGAGVRPFLSALIAEKMAGYCLGVTTTVMASAILGAGAILYGGTEEQKRRVLPKIAGGEWLCAFAFTEPDAGSDVFNLSTRAERRGSSWVLDGTKQWITNAGQADVYCVFALTGEGDARSNLSCFMVEKDSGGLSFGPLEAKMGIRCSHTRQVRLEGVEVPEENLLTGPGTAFLPALKSLARSRSCLAAAAVGLAEAAYREAVGYTLERRQFGKPVLHFQAVQHMLADMLVQIESARLISYRAVSAVLHDDPKALVHSAIAKYHAAEVAMQVATDALQLHGGYGFSKDYPIEKMFRDAKILAIYEGTSQMMKNQIGSHVIQDGAQRASRRGR